MKTTLIKFITLFFALLCTAFSDIPTDETKHEILLIIGAYGEESYAVGFQKAADNWIEASKKAGARITVVGLEAMDTKSDKQQIENWIASIEPKGPVPAWLVYVGHGTHNQKQTLLNLRGPDLDSKTLTSWLDPIQRPLIVIHGGSASAPFLSALSKENRIILSATRTGDEMNYARFGERFASIINSQRGDIDQDGQVSLLEAFVSTSQEVQLSYKESGRLASEHALIDDNGDSAGTPAEWFRGTRLSKRPADNKEADGFRSNQIAFIPSDQERNLTNEQRAARNQLELEVETLRTKKSSMEEDSYYEELESLLLQLSEIYLPSVGDPETKNEAGVEGNADS